MESISMITLDDISWIKQLSTPERDRGVTRTYYSYPAKFQAKLPRGLIERFTQKTGDLVLDPFSGGGTVGLEAMLLNRRFIGYDINPFAILVSKVKTTYLEPDKLEATLMKILSGIQSNSESLLEVLDSVDKECLGSKIAKEINSLFTEISQEYSESVRNFFILALMHSIKIVGRRDFEQKSQGKKKSILPIFTRKSRKMIREIKFLPMVTLQPPEFKLASSHNMDLDDNSTDLIIASPPYKDKDVEYQKIQIQRRSLQRSKRSDVISKILGMKPLTKEKLCWTGNKGKNYWENTSISLNECFRVLKSKKYAFIWTGFKNQEDLLYYEDLLRKANFFYLNKILINLSDDRVASGRSTHHGKSTGMMEQDYLFILQKP